MPSKDSKTNFALLRDKILQKSGKDYWRSVEEFADAPEFEEFVKHEYPQHAETWEDGLSRRNFIKVMGASLALAGLSGCVIQPAEKIVPYVSQPEEIVPGKPLYYATAMSLGGTAIGLLAKSNEGRPTKIEGNPEHPQSLGATDILAQASLLDMYDPDRSQEILKRGNVSTWQNFMLELRARVDENRADGGAGIRFLTETVTSPTMIAQMRGILSELPNARWYQYEPINCDNEIAGAKMAFGSPAKPLYRFDQATRILSLDKDIFSDFNVRYTKDFNKSRVYRNDKTDINRLYTIETTMTLTGAKSDHRLGVKPSQMTEIAKAIAAALGVSGATSTYTENADWIQAMARDLKANGGKSLVVAGDNQPPMVHALANAMNQTLGAVGTTVTYVEPYQPFADVLQIDQLRQLVQEIDNKAVKMLIILGGNPVYNAPADLRLTKQRLDNVPFRVHVGLYQDETAEICHWHIPAKHYLESWGDARAYDGTVSIVQPLIQPLYDGKSPHEVAQLFFRENYDKRDFDIVRENWQRQGFASAPRAMATTATSGNQTPANNQGQQTANQVQLSNNQPRTPNATQNQGPATTGGAPMITSPENRAANPAGGSTNPTTASSFEDSWRKAVHDGIVQNSAATAKTVSVNGAFMNQPMTTAASGDLEISIRPDPSVYDGRFANNGWLQELPNPLTKITWENVALVSPNTAKRLGLNESVDGKEYSGGARGETFINTKGGNLFSDLVTLKMNGGEVGNVPMWIAPGQPDDVVTIYLGYGRTRAGRIGTNLGYSAYNVQRSDAMHSAAGELTKTGEQKAIASTQIHFAIREERKDDILRVWDLEYFNANPTKDHQHDHYPDSMYPRYEYTGNKWGMTVDLNSCVGCNACVIACQSENNIPVVGKEQIERSREMHWMRIDTYYSGNVENPEGPHFQPMLCQQCELAPCETVCPVHATVHSAEGLNDMVYNRCVGTRYCSNNCPYKVRRFNFLLYQDWNTPQYKLMRNPEVTVRSRGVMEKCTYCTQRIAYARIEAEKDDRPIRDGEILTACQSVCPADAIVFGDLNDPTSQVSKLKTDHRNYNVLNTLNTQPRTTYLAGLKNQNKEMPDYRAPKVSDSGHVAEDKKGNEASH